MGKKNFDSTDFELFSDRIDAGRRLAAKLQKFRDENPLIVALPRGGMPVAWEVAKALRAPLDFLVVRKVGHPKMPELGVGATTEDDITWINPAAELRWGVDPNSLPDLVRREQREVQRKLALYRKYKKPVSVVDRTVIVVDDGLATGATAAVAAKVLRKRGAGRILLASPVCTRDTAERLHDFMDEIVCFEQVADLTSVGDFYRDFEQISDERVIDVLKEADKTEDGPETIEISDGFFALPAYLWRPRLMRGFVLFAHGSGSSKDSPRNLEVARALNQASFGTLLFDLLTDEEARERGNVFDIPLLADRLLLATRWIQRRVTDALPLGYFGASTGAGAALRAAALLGDEISAVVSRGGRPDLAGRKLREVRAPTLLIAGGADTEVLALNRRAALLLPHGEVQAVPAAGHLFEETGAMDEVKGLATDWFSKYLKPRPQKEFFAGMP